MVDKKEFLKEFSNAKRNRTRHVRLEWGSKGLKQTFHCSLPFKVFVNAVKVISIESTTCTARYLHHKHHHRVFPSTTWSSFEKSRPTPTFAEQLRSKLHDMVSLKIKFVDQVLRIFFCFSPFFMAIPYPFSSSLSPI